MSAANARPEADAIVVGAGLAGLVAACEIADAGRTVLLLEREGWNDVGGQAFWSFGGLFLVDSPEQRRLGVRDSLELARRDWFGSAGFDRAEDHWPRQWAEAYLDFAAGEKRAWLRAMGHRFFRSSAGPSAATAAPRASATPCRASTSPGARAPASWSPSCAVCDLIWRPAGSAWACAMRSAA